MSIADLPRVCGLLMMLLALAWTSPNAEARRIPVCIGSEDDFRVLAALRLPPDDIGLPAAWMTGRGKLVTHVVNYCFGLPLWTSVEGYAIRVGNAQKYWPLDAPTIESLQSFDVLPTPLPPHDAGLLTSAQGRWGLGLLLLLVLAVMKELWSNFRSRRGQALIARMHTRIGHSFLDVFQEVLVAAGLQRPAPGTDTERAIIGLLNHCGNVPSVIELPRSDGRWNRLEPPELLRFLKARSATMTDDQKALIAHGTAIVLRAEGALTLPGKRWLQQVLKALRYNDATIKGFVKQTALAT